MNFLQGQVSAAPKNCLENVPVQIFSHTTVSDENKENDSVELFRFLWRNAHQVTESWKNCRPNKTKYQQNFSVLVREVLGSNLHLFVGGEKDFMGKTLLVMWHYIYIYIYIYLYSSNSLWLCFCLQSRSTPFQKTVRGSLFGSIHEKV